ncbi:prestin-like [Saccostrea echinata]|uniref:prestin-like n=1 Tax=Saccostrea echinata TaxID=191078 RepID=UPI002A8164B4|nr:prestin-like [Saccostrea echinata]
MNACSENAKICDFNERFRKRHEVPLHSRLKNMSRRYFSKQYYKRCARKTFPFVKTVQTYKIRKYLANDIISGLTVGVMQIPQGMAYAMLSSLPPICGLYISFFGPLVYFFLGTSKHVSMGCISVVSLMIGSVMDDATSDPTFSVQNTIITQNLTSHSILGPSENISIFVGNNTEFDSMTNVVQRSNVHPSIDSFKIEIASALSLVSGVVMIILGRFGFGIITTYMPEPMVSGFTSAVAFLIITAQAKHIFGLNVFRFNGYFKIIKTWVAILKNIGDTQWLPLVIFTVSFIILYVVKVHINIRYKKRLKVPIPADLIVVVLATVITYTANLYENNGLNVVKDIPAGFPSLNIPDLKLVIPLYLKDAVMIGIVAFTQTVSIAKILAQTNNYDINPNQEMVAYGAGSLACSLFSGYIPAGSVGRSMVQESAGGKTQVASLFGCLVVLVVIVAIGPLFYNLPKCVLSAVVLMSLRGMFLQYLELPSLWRKSKIDFMIWIVTAASTIVLDAEIGIVIGIAFSIFTVTFRTQRAYGYKAGFVEQTNILRNVKRYQPIRSDDDNRIHFVQYHGPVFFANADHFMRTVYQKSGLEPKVLRKSKKQQGEVTVTVAENTENELDEKETLTNERQKIVIDFTAVNFVDLVGVKTIKRVHSDYNVAGVDVLFVGCNDDVIDMLTKCDAMKELSPFLITSVESLLSHINNPQTHTLCNGKEICDNGCPPTNREAH